jgi:hypothetical protein
LASEILNTRQARKDSKPLANMPMLLTVMG